MKVSVIIPALNEASVIATSVRRAWEAGADEVLVVDGGSEDQTPSIAESATCRLVVAPRGRASQQNAAAALARGDVLLFLHADNWLPPAAIDQIRHALDDAPAVHGAFRQRIDAPGIGFRILEWGNARRVRWFGLPFGDQGIFIRRGRFDELGGFPQVDLMEDVLLARQLRRQEWPLLLPGPLFVSPRRWQRHGIVRQTLRNWSLLAAQRLGVSPDRLARHYRRHDA